MKKKYYVYQMDIKLLNILSIIIALFLCVLLVILYKGRVDVLLNNGLSLAMVFLIPYFCLHEVFHSIAYVLHGASFSKITYGAHIEKGILCCLCKQNITKKNILISLLYPFIFLGVIAFIIGYYFDLYFLVLLAVMNISGCAGDFIMFYHLVKIKDYEYSEFDDPIGFGLYTNEDLSKKKFKGLNFIKETSSLERKDFKKITISKPSIIYMLLLSILGLANYFLDK